jgi:hypothetical protein
MNLGTGKCSSFGGPNDMGVGPKEELSCIDLVDLSEWWFDRIFLASSEWDDSKGPARNLNPRTYYCAMRWGYGSFGGVQGEILPNLSREQIRWSLFRITAASGASRIVQAADWGPNTDTGRLIDLSPQVLTDLKIQTNDPVTVELLT